MRTYVILVLVMAFWGSAFASSKLAVHDVPPEVAAFVRFGLAAVILLAVHPVLTRGAARPAPAELGRLAGLGLVGIFGYNVAFFFALTLAPSADGSVIVPATTPVITVAVTALLGRRRLSGRTILGLAAALTGAAVFFAGIPAGGDNRLLGDLVFIAGSAFWSAYTIFGAPVLARLPAFTVTTYATAAGTLALGALALPGLGDVAWSELDTRFWLNQAYLAALPTALAYVLYYRAVRQVGPATASSGMFLVPVFGLACSWLLLGESITLVQAAGSVLLLAGAWLATRDRQDVTSAPPRTTSWPTLKKATPTKGYDESAAAHPPRP